MKRYFLGAAAALCALVAMPSLADAAVRGFSTANVNMRSGPSTAYLAVIVGVRYFGLWQGRQASPSATMNSAQVAAVIVNPTALNKASTAVEGHTEATRALPKPASSLQSM